MSNFATRTVAADFLPERLARRLTDDRLIEVLLVVYFPLMIAARWYASDDPSLWVGLLEATITAVAWFCAAWTVGWVVWRVTGGRGRVGQMLFGVSLVALVSSSMAMAALQRTRAEAEADTRFRQAGLAFLDTLESAVDDRDVALGEADAMRSFAGEMERYALRLDGMERGRALAGAAVMREQAPLTADFNKAGKAFVDAGGLYPASLETEAALDQRLALAWAFADATERIGAMQSRRADRFVELASLYGVGAGELAEARVWFDRVFAARENEELLGLERQVADAAVGILRLLRDEWGRWHYDRAQRRLVFDREATENRYVGLYVELTQAETQKRSLQRRLLDENRRRLAEPPPGESAAVIAEADG
jgi:hypothetical protein